MRVLLALLLIVVSNTGVLVEATEPEIDSADGQANTCQAKGRLLAARMSRKSTGRLEVAVESRLVKSNLPADPLIDFALEARRQGLEGVLDPDSIRVVNRVTGQEVAHSLGPGFRHGDSGRVRWLITDPRQARYTVSFRTSRTRRVASTRERVPLIGVGDLLRYNATEPRRIGGLVGLSRMVDLTGDGRLDLVSAGMYTFESGWPGTRIPHDWGGLWCRPALGRDAQGPGPLLFGDRIPLRYKTSRESKKFHQFNAGYIHGDAADLNGDGRPDLLFATATKSSRYSRISDVHHAVHLFLDSGDRDAGGMPIYLSAGRVPHPPEHWGPVRAVDLDGDGAVDLVLGSMYRDGAGPGADVSACYIRNRNSKGWPFEPAEPVTISVGRRPCFFDVDGDGRLDSVCLVADSRTKRLNRSSRLGWRRNQGEFPPRFASARVLEEVDLKHCYTTAAVTSGPRPGVVVSYRSWQRAAFLEAVSPPSGETSSSRRRRFVTRKLVAPSPEIALGDQATPFPCDWDADGDWDLLVGGGYGDVRIVINSGTTARPRFETPRPVLADSRPIEIHMSTVFPGLDEYGHNMGYPHPSFVDWDGDGLRDLMVPNITNRVFWYRNVGTPAEPRFGPRRQVICDGFDETTRTLRATASLLGADTKEWTKRVPDPHSPFGWRSRGGFGDFNGDGLCDMVTTDGQGPPDNNRYAAHSAIFVQYRDGRGRRRLKKQQVVTLPDGKPLTNVVGQPAQLIPVDWDRDGLLDLVINHGATLDTAPAVVRNIGTRTEPRFDFPRRLKCFGEELSGIAKHGPYYGVGDLDGDGRSDLLACPEMGTYHFFRRTALDMPRRPRFVIGRGGGQDCGEGVRR